MIRINSFSSDTGILGDGITSDSSLTLTGTATASSTVNLYDGTTLLGTTTANANGAWTYTTATLSDGAHSFTAATTTTSGGNSSGFPDASTTGVPPGTSLTTAPLDSYGTFHTSYAGQVIDALNVNGTIIVEHPGVIIRNSQAQYIYVNADNVTIQDSTITGQNTGGSGITLLRSDNSTIQRCDIAGVENGIWLESNGCVIADNYIHDLRNNRSSDPHYDGIQIPWGGISNNLITHNNLDLALDVSSSITMTDAINIDITNNRLHGGTYTIYFEGNTTGSDVTNNVFAGHYFGDVAGAAANGQTFTGNVYGDTTASRTAATATTDTSSPLVVTIDTTVPTDGGTSDGGVSQGGSTSNGGGTSDGGVSQGGSTTNGGGTSDGGISQGGGTTGGGTNVPDDDTTAPQVEFTNVRQKFNDKVVFQGTADAGDQIAIHDNDGTVVGTTTARSDGTFSFTTRSALADNVVHNFTTTVTDSNGQSVATSGNVILGTARGDQLSGTSGNDLFRGNGGHDTFEFAANFGRDVITDFGATRSGHDVIEFSNTAFHNFAEVLSHASQVGHDVVIDDGGGNTLTLTNTALRSLDRTDFHFA